MDCIKSASAILPLILVFGLEMIVSDSLFERSLIDIPEMQVKHKLKPLMQNVGLIGSMPVTFGVVVLAINLMSKPASFFFVSGLMFVQFLSRALGSIYSQPRPYWISDSIQSDQCLTSYGNPSKVLANYSFIVLTLYLHKYYEVGVV